MGFPAGHSLQAPVHTWSLSNAQLPVRNSFFTQEKLVLLLSPQRKPGSYALLSWSYLCRCPWMTTLKWNEGLVQRDLEGEGCQPQTDLQVLSMICLEERAEILAYFFSTDSSSSAVEVTTFMSSICLQNPCGTTPGTGRTTTPPRQTRRGWWNLCNSSIIPGSAPISVGKCSLMTIVFPAIALNNGSRPFPNDTVLCIVVAFLTVTLLPQQNAAHCHPKSVTLQQNSLTDCDNTFRELDAVGLTTLI